MQKATTNTMFCAWWPQDVHARVAAAVSGPPSSVQRASWQQLAGLLSTGAPKPSQAGPQLPCKRYVDLWLSQRYATDNLLLLLLLVMTTAVTDITATAATALQVSPDLSLLLLVPSTTPPAVLAHTPS